MQWTMPHRALQIVASLIVLAAITSFVLGVMSTPQRSGRLPGQKTPGAPAAVAIDATEATPLSQERIEGPPPEEEKPEEEGPPPPAANASAPAAEATAGNTPVIAPPPPPSQPLAPDANSATAFPPDEPPH